MAPVFHTIAWRGETRRFLARNLCCTRNQGDSRPLARVFSQLGFLLRFDPPASLPVYFLLFFFRGFVYLTFINRLRDALALQIQKTYGVTTEIVLSRPP